MKNSTEIVIKSEIKDTLSLDWETNFIGRIKWLSFSVNDDAPTKIDDMKSLKGGREFNLENGSVLKISYRLGNLFVHIDGVQMPNYELDSRRGFAVLVFGFSLLAMFSFIEAASGFSSEIFSIADYTSHIVPFIFGVLSLLIIVFSVLRKPIALTIVSSVFLMCFMVTLFIVGERLPDLDFLMKNFLFGSVYLLIFGGIMNGKQQKRVDI